MVKAAWTVDLFGGQKHGCVIQKQSTSATAGTGMLMAQGKSLWCVAPSQPLRRTDAKTTSHRRNDLGAGQYSHPKHHRLSPKCRVPSRKSSQCSFAHQSHLMAIRQSSDTTKLKVRHPHTFKLVKLPEDKQKRSQDPWSTSHLPRLGGGCAPHSRVLGPRPSSSAPPNHQEPIITSTRLLPPPRVPLSQATRFGRMTSP